MVQKDGKVRTMHRIRAFTLIELLIVVAIIGILAAIAVPNFMNARIRAKISRAVADMRSIQTALEMYRTDNGAYMLGPIGIETLEGGSFQGDRVWRQITTPIAYMSTFLRDPFTPMNVADNPGAADRFFPLRLYQYRNIAEDVFYGVQGDPDPRGQWLARSAGPDGWFYSNPSCLYRNMAYSATNGVNSPGDIIVSNLGILGEGYAGRIGAL